MSYPHHPYGYEPTHCPVIGLVPRRRHIIDVDCSDARDEPETLEIEEKPVPSERRLGFPFGCTGESAFGPADIEGMIEYVVATRQAGALRWSYDRFCVGGVKMTTMTATPSGTVNNPTPLSCFWR